MDQSASADSPASPVRVRPRLFGAAIVDLLIVMAVGGGTVLTGLLRWEAVTASCASALIGWG